MLGVTDDLTGPARLKENATSYLPQPSPKLGYFALATARDPRVLIVHEGALLSARALRAGKPIRRHYYDSDANEGIGFYAEEMALQAGLSDDSPRSREIIYSFMRLRAARGGGRKAGARPVHRQASGGLFAEDRADGRRHGARGGCILRLHTGPGDFVPDRQAADHADVVRSRDATRGAKFNLKSFHDFVWKNGGNVSIALQRWNLSASSQKAIA